MANRRGGRTAKEDGRNGTRGNITGNTNRTKEGGARKVRRAGATTPSLRRAWFSKKLPVDDTVLAGDELGRAPFALIVDYVAPLRGVYRVKLQVVARDEDAVTLIERHKLQALPIFMDRAAAAIDEERQELGTYVHERVSRDGLKYLWSHRPIVDAVRFAHNTLNQARVVRITFGTLLDGIEIKGSFEEVRRVTREVTMAIDKIGAAIDAGQVFDLNETRIFAPGTRAARPETRIRVLPSRWGK